MQSLKITTISQALEKYANEPVPLFSFAFDDGYSSTLEKAYPILYQFNFPATVFVITSRVGEPGCLTKENLHFLSQHGWEIGSHSVNHKILTKLPEKQIRTELLDSKQCLENWGFKVNTFAYPGGAGNELVWSLTRQYYQSSRGIASRLHYRPFSPHHLGNFAPMKNSKIQLYKERIDQCTREASWLILSFHEIDGKGKFSSSSKFLTAICDYLASKEKEEPLELAHAK